MEKTAKVLSFKRFAVHDGDGVRTTVFLAGCPLRCVWCHNPEGLDGKARLAYFPDKCLSCGLCAGVCRTGAHTLDETGHHFDRSLCVSCGACAEVCIGDALTFYGREMTVDAVVGKLLEDRAFYGERGGVTLSGGECLIHPDFCAEVAERCRAEGVGVDIDTCGDVPWETFERLLPDVDTFLYDVKAISDEVHRRCTGRGNARILENLKKLTGVGARVEIRVPYVPAYNDGEMGAIAAFLADLPIVGVRVLPYHDLAHSKYLSLGMEPHLPPRVPTGEEMENARALFRAAGVRVIS